MENFNISSDIREAHTLPTQFYTNSLYFEQAKEKIFARSWQWLGDNSAVQLPQHVQPLIVIL
jgi:choline monooxygenase